MEKIHFLAFLFLLTSNLYSQSEQMVNTPFGPARRSNVHFVDKMHYLKAENDQILIINSKTNVLSKNIKLGLDDNSSSSNLKRKLGDKIEKAYNSSTSIKEGWITYADGQIYMADPKPINYFSVNCTVPSPPLIESNQILYLFNGLMTIKSGRSHIIQPVLQWGISPAGGGKYWAINNWYVVGDDQFFYDSLIKVYPGTKLQGEIKLISINDTLFNYYSSFVGYDSGMSVFNIPRLVIPSIVLETYGVTGCDEFPIDEKICMKNIQIMTDSIYPPLKWSTNNEADKPPYYCKQYTTIISESSSSGEIDIHFHLPTDINNFSDIHLYPNPVEKILHISPNKLLNNCRIEIYNSTGSLMDTYYYQKLDNELDLNLQHLSAGLYIIKFYYNSTIHSFKIIRN